MIINNISTLIGIKRLRIADVARIANVDYTTIANLYYDNTKSISFKVMDRLCYALECKPNDLFRYIPDDEYEELKKYQNHKDIKE